MFPDDKAQRSLARTKGTAGSEHISRIDVNLRKEMRDTRWNIVRANGIMKQLRGKTWRTRWKEREKRMKKNKHV